MSEEELQQRFELEKEKFKQLSKEELKNLNCVSLREKFPDLWENVVLTNEVYSNDPLFVINKKIKDETVKTIFTTIVEKIRSNIEFNVNTDDENLITFLNQFGSVFAYSNSINLFNKLFLNQSNYTSISELFNDLKNSENYTEFAKVVKLKYNTRTDKNRKKNIHTLFSMYYFVKNYNDYPLIYPKLREPIGLIFGVKNQNPINYDLFREMFNQVVLGIEINLRWKEFYTFGIVLRQLLGLQDIDYNSQTTRSTNIHFDIIVTTSPLNLILYGPPGTGKTYTTKQKAIDILNEKIIEETKKLKRDDIKDYQMDFSKDKPTGQIAFTTFHQSMTYEDFIEGIKPLEPTSEDRYLKYKTEDGIFKKMCNLAKGKPNDNFVLIIDEINRGNVSQIFGELITLIEEDKRENVRPEIDKKVYETIEVTLPYSKNPFTVPNNLYIVGTMNTADRSVEALDTALRRRFVFEELMPKHELLDFKIEAFGSKLCDILYTINNRIEILLDRDHLIGHSYFMDIVNKKGVKKEDYPKLLLEKMYNQIIPLLQEYFYNDYEKIGMILGSGFVRKETTKTGFADFKVENSNDYSEKVIYSILPKDTEELRAALDQMKIEPYKPHQSDIKEEILSAEIEQLSNE